MVEEGRGLGVEELTLDYYKFKDLEKYIKNNHEEFHLSVHLWLSEWSMFDLMFKYGREGDTERRFARMGHYFGFFSNHKEH